MFSFYFHLLSKELSTYLIGCNISLESISVFHVSLLSLTLSFLQLVHQVMTITFEVSVAIHIKHSSEVKTTVSFNVPTKMHLSLFEFIVQFIKTNNNNKKELFFAIKNH